MDIETVEKTMAQRRGHFFALVTQLTPFQADEKATLLDLAIARMIDYMPDHDRLSMIKKEFHAGRDIKRDGPASYTCHAFNEAHFSIMGNYSQGLPHHLRSAKCDVEGKYDGTENQMLHRFNVSAYTGKIFDVSLDQYRVPGEEPDHHINRKYLSYGKNGFPADHARMAIHYLAAIFEDPKRGHACFGHMYEGYRAELYPLTKAAADYWPTKEQRDEMGLDFFNRTRRQARAHLEAARVSSAPVLA